MPVTLDQLSQFGFRATHRIVLDTNGDPCFAPIVRQGTAKPSVYLWLQQREKTEEIDVLYVGKAGKGVMRRCEQHQAGFMYGVTGRKNAKALREILTDTSLSITVMSRRSSTVEHFGQTVSAYATEEAALCALYKPRLNRAVFPGVTIDDAGAAPGTAMPNAPGDGAPAAHHDEILQVAALINGRLREHEEGTADDTVAQIESYGPDDLRRLRSVLDYLGTRLQGTDEAKLVGNYTDQPEGCNGVTTLGFGRLRGRNFAPRGWVARIYMTRPLRVGFPLRMLNGAAQNDVNCSGDVFSPRNLDDFLTRPGDFFNQ